MRILVTGASGFLGRAIVAAGADAGHHMIAVNRAGTQVPGAAEVQACGDLLAGVGAIALDGVDCVVNCAARVHVTTREDPASADAAYLLMNVERPVELALRARAAGVRSLIQISSVAAIASQTSPGETLGDDSTPHPVSPYGRAKLLADQRLAELAREDFAVISLRPPAIYGPGVGAWFAMLLRAASHGIPLPVGAISNRRSFAFVGNVADAVLCAARAGIGESPSLVRSGSFTLADSLPLSTADLYRKLLALHGFSDRAWRWPAPLMTAAAHLVLGERAASLTGDAAFDGSRFAREFDWQAPTGMDTALRLTVEQEASAA